MPAPTIPASQPPFWATDDTVTTGPDVGRSVRLAPGASQAYQGHLADEPVAARHANWLDGGLSDWTRRLAVDGLTKWSKCQAYSDEGSIGTVTNRQLVGYDGIARICQEYPTVGVDTGILGVELPTDVSALSFYTDEHAFRGSRTGLLDDNQSIWAPVQDSPDATYIVRTPGSDLTSGTVITVDAAIGQIRGMCKVSASRYLAWTTSAIYRSTNGGVVWTDVTPATDYGTVYGCGTSDGTADGRVVLTYYDTGSGTVRVLLSEDGGETWGPSEVGSGLGAAGVTRTSAGFVLITLAGARYLLADGASTWTSIGTDSGFVDSGDVRVIAADGGARVVYLTTTQTGGGVNVSIDGGYTWTYVQLWGGSPTVTDLDAIFDGLRFWVRVTFSGGPGTLLWSC